MYNVENGIRTVEGIVESAIFGDSFSSSSFGNSIIGSSFNSSLFGEGGSEIK